MSDAHDDPGTDDLDGLGPVTDEERREAEALARALEGEDDERAPVDATSTAAFVRAVARDGSLDASVAKTGRSVFGGEPRAGARPKIVRPITWVAAVLASAAGVLVFARSVVPTPEVETASRRPAGVVAFASPPPVPVESLADAERALLDATPETKDDALAAFREAWSASRDARLAALIAERGGPR